MLDSINSGGQISFFIIVQRFTLEQMFNVEMTVRALKMWDN